VTVDVAEPAPPLLSAGLIRSGFFRHREGLSRHRLDARARALFLPGEQIVLTFDGITRIPNWRFFGTLLIGNGLGGSGAAAFGLRHHDYAYEFSQHQLETGLSVLAVGIGVRLVCRLLGSRRVMVATTTLGVVECSTDWLNRPRAILQRGTADEPVFYESGQRFKNIGIGPVDVYTSSADEAMLLRTMKRVPPRRLAHFAPLHGPWRDAAS